MSNFSRILPFPSLQSSSGFCTMRIQLVLSAPYSKLLRTSKSSNFIQVSSILCFGLWDSTSAKRIEHLNLQLSSGIISYRQRIAFLPRLLLRRSYLYVPTTCSCSCSCTRSRFFYSLRWIGILWCAASGSTLQSLRSRLYYPFVMHVTPDSPNLRNQARPVHIFCQLHASLPLCKNRARQTQLFEMRMQCIIQVLIWQVRI